MSKQLTEQQELFCIAMITEGETLNNQVKSYASAYGYELPLNDNGDVDTKSGDYNTCSVGASNTMKNTNIQTRLRELYNEMFNDNTFWDAQLTKVAKTGNNTDIISASRHRNDLKQRITKKIDVTTAGRPLQGLSDEELAELAG